MCILVCCFFVGHCQMTPKKNPEHNTSSLPSSSCCYGPSNREAGREGVTYLKGRSHARWIVELKFYFEIKWAQVNYLPKEDGDPCWYKQKKGKSLSQPRSGPSHPAIPSNLSKRERTNYLQTKLETKVTKQNPSTEKDVCGGATRRQREKILLMWAGEWLKWE